MLGGVLGFDRFGDATPSSRSPAAARLKEVTLELVLAFTISLALSDFSSASGLRPLANTDRTRSEIGRAWKFYLAGAPDENSLVVVNAQPSCS